MEPSQIETIARALGAATRSCQPIAPLSVSYPDMTIVDAYAIQRLTRQTLVSQGATHIGFKVGATSEAIRQMFGIDQPDFGFVTDAMVIGGSDAIDTSHLIQPQIEGEVAFVISKDIGGSRVTARDVLSSSSHVIPTLEVLDSRIEDWKIGILDTVADNASIAAVVFGAPVGINDVDLTVERMRLTVGQQSVEGTGIEVMGHPAEGVAWLARRLDSWGETLRAGQIVLAGAWAGAIALSPGETAEASFDTLGSVRTMSLPS